MSDNTLLGLDYDLNEIHIGSSVVCITDAKAGIGSVEGAGKGDSILVSFKGMVTPVLVISDELAVLATGDPKTINGCSW